MRTALDRYLKIVSLIFFMSLPSTLLARAADRFIISKGNYATLALPVINKDYLAFEFGFLTEKKIKAWNYEYNAYFGGTLFQDWEHQKENQRAGGLGFRGGVILPFQPWIPLLFTTTIGFSKTVLHRDPFFGNSKKNISKKDMYSFEVGLLYRIDEYFIRAAYQVSNVKYVTRNSIFFFGVYY